MLKFLFCLCWVVYIVPFSLTQTRWQLFVQLSLWSESAATCSNKSYFYRQFSNLCWSRASCPAFTEGMLLRALNVGPHAVDVLVVECSLPDAQDFCFFLRRGRWGCLLLKYWVERNYINFPVLFEALLAMFLSTGGKQHCSPGWVWTEIKIVIIFHQSCFWGFVLYFVRRN